MKTKTIILVPLITSITMFILNGVFHAVIIADFFDRSFAAFGNSVRPVKETNPALLFIVEATWVCALFYLLTAGRTGTMKRKHAVIGGMLMNASICGTWNFINLSMFPVYPVQIILPDMAWHTMAIGSMAGLLVSWLYNKFEQKPRV